MKFLLSLSLVVAFAGAAVADIQSPPASQHTPVRKLGRGISNVLYGWSEIPFTMSATNDVEGNSAAFGFGIVQGVHRAFYRFGKGIYEIATSPAPTYKGSYRPPYSSAYIWGAYHGYTEFPPELGFETRFNYSRTYHGY